MSNPSVTLNGPWDHAQVERFLSDTVYPLRLACIGPDEFPRVVSLWFKYAAGRLHCVTHKSSKLMGLIQASPRVGFEVSTNDPPYFGVRGQGLVTVSPLDATQMLDELLERYLDDANTSLQQWLRSRAADERIIQIEPTRFFSWDYRARMND
ncbi:MAG: pyridoxamine 5'-phosphate oxidase family protein [Gammaproteobacteria bacterium]|nr:pyridoxamine 5'-phosphate oxidase family protein [Gammaproteobacteria bacterium]